MKVLVIEDDASIRKVLVGLLRRMFDELDPWAAESADEAISHLRNSMCDGKQFDLVISDYDLIGGQTGGDVLAWIRGHASYLVPRFIFLSGNLAARDLHERFLEKPCETSVLRQTIRDVLAAEG